MTPEALDQVKDILGILGVIAAMIFSGIAMFRNKKQDDSSEGKQSGTILTEIGYIKANTDEIKTEQRTQRDTNIKVFERLASVEASAKQAHKRLDDHMQEDKGK